MKRIIALMLIALCALPLGAAAQAIYKTADIDAEDAFRDSVTWALDGDQWSAYDEAAYYELLKIEAGQRRGEMRDGFCYMFLSVRGDRRQGLVEVVLNVCVFRTEPVAGSGIMISVDGMRYEYPVAPSRESAGNYGYDLYRLPLDKEGVAMVRSLAAHGGMVFAYNDKKGFRGAAGETSHLTSLFELLPDWYANYTLWAENAALWRHIGLQPEIVKLLSPDPAGYADADFNVLATASKANVALIQEALRENGFYAFEADGKFGDNTVSAIKAAQRKYGFIENGIADLRLMESLSGKSAAAPNLPEGETGGELTFEAYRVSRELRACAAIYEVDAEQAQGADTAKEADGAQAIAARADDLALLTVIGRYTCEAQTAQNLAYEIEAYIVADDCYRYPCSVRCEYPGCTDLGTEILPLQRAKVLLIAELPLSAIRSAELELRYSFGGAEVALALEPFER